MIQVGQVLDKYELLERVGQGGMAIVYRGIDRDLKRTVAIKVLHRHLSDYQEARDRFEREAQAVAKLRHENILEIFDYSAKAGSESYIVTEFIDGQTLKQFITDRPIQYPEVGAMVMLQVCRALSHAHAIGILHRDIKPENIMIRSDGIVKLMDFGISHMVDLERLTVTGQLLGSPAYMAPEHVEGRQLDFRTDVFAVGIVLYQLCVGKLPFEGKNPHEVLKRIAECRFVDPRQANPRIGNRLGRIILRAMAALPNDRYPAISEMVLALEAYLTESGLPTDKLAGELARYFKSPGTYEQALKERLLDTLTRRGQQLLDDENQAGALDVFDRVLTIDPDNAKVLTILERINRRAKLKTVGIAVLGAVVLAGGAFAIHEKMKPPPPEMPVVDPDQNGSAFSTARFGPGTNTGHVEAPPPDIDAAVIAIAQPDAPVSDPGHHDIVAPADALPVGKPIHVAVSPAKGAKVRFGDEPDWHPLAEDGFLERVIDHKITVHVKNDRYEDQDHDLSPGDPTYTFQLSLLPAKVIPVCKDKRVSVTVNGKPARLDEEFPSFFPKLSTDTEKAFDVQFIADQPGSGSAAVQVDSAIKHVVVKANDIAKVECVLR